MIISKESYGKLFDILSGKIEERKLLEFINSRLNPHLSEKKKEREIRKLRALFGNKYKRKQWSDF